MVQNFPDERSVYLALKGVFKGKDALVRQEKKVRALIQKQKDQADIKHLIQEYTIVRLSQTAKALLKDRIFESTLKAKERFPEVFEVSADQTAERAISELATAKNEDAAIQSVAEGHQDKCEQSVEKLASDNFDQSTKPGMLTCEAQYPKAEKKNPATQEILAPNHTKSNRAGASLYPVYFPFQVQHRLLNRVQSILENACYAFARNKFPSILQQEGWDCAEAVELNRWSRVFLTHQSELDTTDLDTTDLAKSLCNILNSIAQLRHTAVHRLRLTANRTLQFIVHSESLVKLLHDDAALDVISGIRRHVQFSIGEMERNKDLLELQMVNTKAHFAAKKAELDAQERQALEFTNKEDKEYTAFAGASLEQALDAPTATAPNEASALESQERKPNDDAGSSGKQAWSLFSENMWSALGYLRKPYAMLP
jgi:hypothetical protein